MADSRKAFDVERAHKNRSWRLAASVPVADSAAAIDVGELRATLAHVPAAPVQAEQVPHDEEAQQ